MIYALSALPISLRFHANRVTDRVMYRILHAAPNSDLCGSLKESSF